jgi:uncharacterized damage-inducible protein DinB
VRETTTMAMTTKDRLIIESIGNPEPEIGRLLWMLEDSRQRTGRVVDQLGEVDLDWAPAPHENSIGALLYHIAAIEADWLYVEVSEQPDFTPEIVALFPEDVSTETGQLALARGYSHTEHLDRLAAVRAKLLAIFADMSLADFRRPRDLPDYAVTPEWVLHHLIQHEDEHRAEIGMLRWLQNLGPDRQ